MKKLFYLLTGICLLAGVFTCCEKKPLDESGDGDSGGGTSKQKGIIEGVVTAKDTQKPVMLASVQLLPTDRLTVTDTTGSFTFGDIEPGNYQIQVKRNGYTTYKSEDIKVEAGKTVRHDVALESLLSSLQILDMDATVISELNIGHADQGVFLLKNAGEEIVEWEIPKLAIDWLSGFSKQAGKLAPDATDTVRLTIDRSKLKDGDNEATLYIGSSVGDKKLPIKASVERSFCFTDEDGEEILELNLSNDDQYRFKIKNTGSDVLEWSVGKIEADWLTLVGKTEGKLEAGESESRILKVDYSKLEEGTHESELLFRTNAGEKTLPVKIKVEMSFRLENNGGEEISELNFGSAASQKFRIKNTGNGILEWKMTATESEWLTLGEKKSGSLQPGAAETITVTIDRSHLAAGDNRATVNISTNAGDKQLKINAYTEISFRLEDESGVEITKVDMSGVDQYRFKIKNTGSDVLSWSLGRIEADWLTIIGKSDGKLEGGESETRTLKVDRTRLEEGTYETDLVFSTNAGEKILPVRVKVEMSFRVENEGGVEISELDFGATSSQKFRIKNTGNGVLAWEISSENVDWLSLGNKKSGSLQPGATETITMTVDRSQLLAGDNRTAVNIRTNAGDKPLSIRANLTLSFQLENEGGMQINELEFGSASSKTFRIKNTGNGVLTWEISSENVNWLTLSNKKSGSLQPGATETITMTIDRSLLVAGDNRGTVNISTNAGDKRLNVNAHIELSYQLLNAQGAEIFLLDLGKMSQGSFIIKNTGNGILEWSVSSAGAVWLSLGNKKSGSLQPGATESIVVNVDRMRLSAGNNQTVVNVTTNAGDKQLQINARLDMSYQLVNEQGETVNQLDLGRTLQGLFKIKNTGEGILEWELTQEDADWLSVSGVTQGQISPNNATTIELTVDLNKVSEGVNETTLYISSPVGDKQLSVHFTGYIDAVVSDYEETAFGMALQMVAVHGGVFQMGATSEQGSDAGSGEKPAHNVVLDGFYIGKYEVTQAQWEAVMGTTIAQQRDKANPFGSLYGVGDNYPMYYVSWTEAQEFCRQLSQMTGKTYRLPTEAEWEYAARGGNKSQHYKYAGSNDIDEVAWYYDNRDNKAQPVGTKKANELGLYDMGGNVWELCSDWYDSYSSSPAVNPQGPVSGYNRVWRGGCWGDVAVNCRVSYRIGNLLGARNYNLGFRVVCEQ